MQANPAAVSRAACGGCCKWPCSNGMSTVFNTSGADGFALGPVVTEETTQVLSMASHRGMPLPFQDQTGRQSETVSQQPTGSELPGLGPCGAPHPCMS